MRDLQHDNVNGFVGACIEPPNVCALSEYCTRGSLKVKYSNKYSCKDFSLWLTYLPFLLTNSHSTGYSRK